MMFNFLVEEKKDDIDSVYGLRAILKGSSFTLNFTGEFTGTLIPH